MNAPTTPAEPSNLEPTIESRLERCRRVVDAMTDIGMGLLEALDPKAPDADLPALALAYSRISRAIRLTLILDLRLDALAAGGLAALFAEPAAAEAAPTDAPEAEAEAAEPADRREDGRLRLDREAPDEALRYLKRPLTEIVAAICAGYGLSTDETAEAQAPFAALTANDDGPPEPTPRRTAGAPVPGSTRDPPANPAAPPRPASPLRSRLLGGTAAAGVRALGP